MHSKKNLIKKGVGRLIFMVVFTPLTSYASPFSLLFRILFYKKI